MVLGAESAIPISDSSTATILDTGEKIYFDSVTYKTDAVIDNYTRVMSGYGWSPDLGWIDFGANGDNPEGPVVADATGHLSGKAKALSGDYIDFNAAPQGSNVVVTGGNFSGYAWSTDVGWIDFTGVAAPGYDPDLLPPDNPTLSTAKNVNGGSTDLTTGNWYNFTNPSFTWNAPVDYAGGGVTPAGIAGYLVYFGTDNTVNITLNANNEVTTSADNGSFHWQSGTTFNSSATLVTDTTYYLKVIAVDTAGNAHYSATSTDYNLFTYKYDNVIPTAPAYVSVNPSGYTRTNSFTFTWPVGGGNGSTDTGGSGLAKYQYRVNSDGTWHDVAGDQSTATITLADAASLGINIFYLQAVDHAGNASSSVRANFYFNNTAPNAPANLAADPATPSVTNSFSFSWTASPGEIAGYYYSVNVTPTLSNASFTANTALAAGPYATQQGQNILYVVAKDNAGNYDFSGCSPASLNYNPNTDTCAAVAFTANTTAPGVPGGLAAYDNSDRNTQDYAVTVKWNEPADTGSGFAGYDVYRSTDGTHYNKVGSTTSVAYADTGLASQIYYYYVVSKDNAGNFSAPAAPVSITPTGRYTTPPNLVSGPTITVNPTSIDVKWATDRVASSFVTIKNGNTFVSEQGESSQTTAHEVKVVGLRAQTSYTFSVRSTDVDGNSLVGPDQAFQTANTPSVYDLNVSNITQSSGIVNFKSTAIADFTLYYGTTADYGKTMSESSGSGTTNHSIAVSNLKPGTMYYFRVVGYDSDGDEIRSDNSFTTLPMPAITAFVVKDDPQATTATLKATWQTNVLTDTVINFAGEGAAYRKASTSDLVTNHEITISDLSYKTKYTIYAAGRDQFGNLAESNKITFNIPIDTRPPKISEITIESSNVGSSSNQAQVAVSWKTDVPSNSQVEYDTGLSGDQYTRKTDLDPTLVKNHLVIISGLNPGQPYHLRILAANIDGVLGQSGDNTVITGDVSKSALQIILNTLQSVFGWMGHWVH